MPTRSRTGYDLVVRWRKKHITLFRNIPTFEAAVELAQRLRAERLHDADALGILDTSTGRIQTVPSVSELVTVLPAGCAPVCRDLT